MGIQAFLCEKKNKYESEDDDSAIEMVQHKQTTAYSPSRHLSPPPHEPDNTNDVNITNIMMGE
jgi:hypothetical protein